MKKNRGKFFIFIIILCFILMGFIFKAYIKDTQNLYNSSINEFYDLVLKVKQDNMKDVVESIMDDIDGERDNILEQCDLFFIRVEMLANHFINEHKITKFYDEIDKEIDKFYPRLLVKRIVINNDTNEIIGSNDEELPRGTIVDANYLLKYKQQYKMYNSFIQDNLTLSLGIKESDIENVVKDVSIKKIRSTKLLDGGYLWIDEIIDFNGGDNYAKRLVHPNLINTEGEMLSTSFQDIKGSLPYKEALEGINKNGEAFIQYYFKKNLSDEVAKKLSYIKLYPKYNWAIGTGVYIDDIESFIYENGMDFRDQLKRQIVVTICTTIILFIITGILGVLIFDYYELKKRLLITKENEIIRVHYSLMENKYDTTNQIIHDIRNHLICIQGLAAKDNADGVLEYTNSINCDISQLGYMVITGNKIIDIILDEKIFLMKSNNIKFKHCIENVNFDFIEYKDAVTILTNLLDNSIESCKLSNKREIDFSIYTFNDRFIVIKLSNSSDIKPSSKGDNLITSKSDKIHHGYGIKNVIKAVNKYNGNLKWSYDSSDKLFTVVIMIPKPTKA